MPDTGRNLWLLYGAANKPTDRAARMSVLIDKDGIVRHVDKSIRVFTYGADVLKRMQELGLAK